MGLRGKGHPQGCSTPTGQPGPGRVCHTLRGHVSVFAAPAGEADTLLGKRYDFLGFGP